MNVLSNTTTRFTFLLKIFLVLYGVILATLHQFYPIPEAAQWVLFAGTMVLTGIPHGAIDHLVDKQNRLYHNKQFLVVDFLKRYLLKMALYALLWWCFPVLAFIVFMGIAAYHFGETDLIALPKHKKVESMLFLSYGWSLLSILLFTHQIEVLVILNSLPNFLETIAIALIALFGPLKTHYFSCCLIWLLGSFYYYHLQSKIGFLPILLVLLQGAVLLVICAQLPFLLAFSFYFGLWHSILCLHNIRQYLKQNNQQLAWHQLAKKAVLFSIIAILGIIIFMIVAHRHSQTSDLLLWLFIGVAILTAPHMEIMSTMFGFIRSQTDIPTVIKPMQVITE